MLLRRSLLWLHLAQFPQRGDGGQQCGDGTYQARKGTDERNEHSQVGSALVPSPRNRSRSSGAAIHDKGRNRHQHDG